MLLKFHQTYNIGDPRANHSRDLDSLLMSSPLFLFSTLHFPASPERGIRTNRNGNSVLPRTERSSSPHQAPSHLKLTKNPNAPRIASVEPRGWEWRLCGESYAENANLKRRRVSVRYSYCKGRAECWELALAVVEDQEERRKGDKVAPPSLACETGGGGACRLPPPFRGFRPVGWMIPHKLSSSDR